MTASVKVASKDNSAFRVRNILGNAYRDKGDLRVFDVWARSLAPERGKISCHFDVVKMVGSLREEIRLVEMEAQKRELPASLYVNYIAKAMQATDVSNLSEQWSQRQKFIDREMLLCFEFLAYMFDGEASVSKGDIAEVEQLLHELEAKLADGEIDVMLKSFVAKQIDILRGSLIEYAVVGAKAFRSTYVKGFAEIVDNEDLIKKNASTPPVDALKTVWDKFKRITDTVVQTNKGIDAWTKFFERGSDVLGLLS